MTSTKPELMSFEDALAAFDPAMGLEVHVELNTATKMFCGCPATFGGEPNTQTCPTCLGLPGSMPVVNGKAVESAIRIGLALNCEIAEWCRFARKNYFYPDMPKNFQTSQYDEPICFDGYMDVEVDSETFRVEIERAHMEEDTGKSLHVGGATGRIHGADHSLVDYNRAGIPLIEIVTRPIMGAGGKAPAVARAYVAQLRDLIVALGVSEARMDQGNLRADVNLSLAPTGSGALGTRTETKNVNSFRSVERAARYEVGRQAAILAGGLDPAGDPALARGHRGHDLGTREVRRRGLPLLPGARPGARGSVAGVGRGVAQHAPGEPDRASYPPPDGVGLLRPGDARHRRRGCARSGRGDHRRRGLAPGRAQVVARRAAPGAPTSPSHRALRRRCRSPRRTRHASRPSSTTSDDQQGQAGPPGASTAYSPARARPDEVVAARGLAVVSDEGALGDAVDRAIEANPDVADKIRDGKVAAAGALIGAVMKEMRGQADAGRVRELILERLQ